MMILAKPKSMLARASLSEMGRAAESRAIFCLWRILQGVECHVSLSFSVPFLSAISCAVYDLQLSVSYL